MMNGLILVQDLKRPNRDPFEVSQLGYEGLQKDQPGRYQSLQKVIVTPEKISVEKREVATPAKAKPGL